MLYGLEINGEALAAGALQHVLLLQEKASRWQEALQAFVQAGMEAGATVVCVGGAPALEDLCRELAARGLDLERQQQAGRLRLLPAGPWPPAAAGRGPASLRALLAGMEGAQGDLRRAGPIVVLDVASLLGPDADLAAAAALGEDVEQMLRRGEVRGCLCLYDRRRLPGEVIKAAVLAHPVLVHDARLFTNRKHVHPSQLHSGDLASLEVQQWVAHVLDEHIGREQMERLLELVERSAQPFVALRPDGRVLMCNASFAALVGYREQELQRMSVFFDLTPPDWHDLERHVLESLEHATRPVRFEKEYLASDGERVPVEVMAHAVRDAAGDIACYYGTVKDLRERRRLLGLQRRFQEEMQFLSETATRWAGVEESEDDHLFIARGLMRLSAARMVAVTSFDHERDSFCVQAVDGEEGLCREVERLLRQPLVGLTLPISEEARSALLSGRLVKVPGGLYELTFGEIPAMACMELERLLGGANLHIMGMTRGGRLFGSVTLMLPAGVSVENQAIIEAFVAQAAVGLQYRWAQEQLQQVNRELERKVEERTARLQAANRVLQAEVERHRRTAEALAASRERYRAFVERLSLGVFTCACDEQVTLRECNQALADILGFGSPEELVGRGLAALCVYPGECQAMRAALQAEGQVRNRDIQVCRRDGTALWVTVSARLIDDAHAGERHVEGVLEDISARQQMEEQLRLSEERFRMAARCTTDVIYQLDMVTGAMEWFGDIDGVLGCGPGESPRTMEDWNRAIHPDDREAVVRAVEQHVARGTPYRCEYRVQRKDGSYRYWLDRGGIIRDHRGTTYTWIGAGTDITERRVAEASLRASEERFRTLADNIAEGIYLVDAGLQPLFYNPAIETIFGRPSSFFMEDHPRAFLSCVHPEDVEKVTEAFFAADPGGSREVTYRIVRPDGEVRYLRDVMRVVRDHSGNIRAYQGLISDITEQHLAEERLRYLSRYDALTGLYNRGYFEAEMRRLQQEQPVPLGMVVCDVDGLKLVNDTLGHEAGDNLLVAAAGVVLDCLDDRATVARIGGDEFAVLLPAADEEEVVRRCHDIRQAVARYNARNPELPLSISLGYAVSTSRPYAPGDVFREADNNMYREKLHRSQSARSAIVQTLMKTLEARDFMTEGHAERLHLIAQRLAQAAGLHERSVTDLCLLAKFHDIGKVGIPDRILCKPGSLTREERDEMRRHAEIGHRIALSAPDLVPIADWILKHHEWWDGNGYPLGLKGEEIPVECRILAIADAWDAMTSDRPYRKAMPRHLALEELRRCAGTQFDPELVEHFVRLVESGSLP